MVSHFDYEHRCLVEKNDPIALILPSRWYDGAESPAIERTSCYKERDQANDQSLERTNDT